MISRNNIIAWLSKLFTLSGLTSFLDQHVDNVTNLGCRCADLFSGIRIDRVAVSIHTVSDILLIPQPEKKSLLSIDFSTLYITMGYNVPVNEVKVPPRWHFARFCCTLSFSTEGPWCPKFFEHVVHLASSSTPDIS
jgi:hypothetical protein